MYTQINYSILIELTNKQQEVYYQVFHELEFHDFFST